MFFLRYRFEDVRLFNINSLLIKDLLRPDERIRISGVGATFVRDTRRNCSVKYSLLDLIARGEQTEPCRYNASDPTNGSYVTADYNVSFNLLGANIGFQKFQASYNYYYTFPGIRSTTLAARGIIGLGHVFSGGDRFNNAQFPSLNGLLPISERFYAGGSNTLRGFNFDEAGPRVVIVPQGTFINSGGKQVFLDPFTVPFGGNALAILNLEARVPLSKSIRAVPFYDGGNVFRQRGRYIQTRNRRPKRCRRPKPTRRLDALRRTRIPAENARRRRIRSRLRLPAKSAAIPHPATASRQRHLPPPARPSSLPLLAGVLIALFHSSECEHQPVFTQ